MDGAEVPDHELELVPEPRMVGHPALDLVEDEDDPSVVVEGTNQSGKPGGHRELAGDAGLPPVHAG